MGVTPPTGSFANAQPYARAPIKRPLIYMGLPLIPATIPQCFSTDLPLVSFTMIISVSRSMLLATATMVKLKRSIFMPWYTVSP